MKAEKTTKAAAYFVVILFFSVVQASLGQAQILTKLPPGELKKDPYVVKLDKMFVEWNTGRLQLPPKSKLQPFFEDRLKKIMEEKKYAYQDQKWAKTMRKKFEVLPEAVKPEKQLSNGAQALLVLLFSKGLADFKARVQLQKVREEMNLPLFMVFGHAQVETAKAGEAEIEFGRIINSLFLWWTTIWPFCE